jgi:hypothetical protein
MALACGRTQTVQGVLIKGHTLSFSASMASRAWSFWKAEHKLAAVLAFINRFRNRKSILKFGFDPSFRSVH